MLQVGSDGTGAGQSANANMGHFKNALSIISVAAIPFIGKMPAVRIRSFPSPHLDRLRYSRRSHLCPSIASGLAAARKHGKQTLTARPSCSTGQ